MVWAQQDNACIPFSEGNVAKHIRCWVYTCVCDSAYDIVNKHTMIYVPHNNVYMCMSCFCRTNRFNNKKKHIRSTNGRIASLVAAALDF